MNQAIRLCSVLEAVQGKYLYHGTIVPRAAQILRENEIAPKTRRTSLTPQPVFGVSLSRSRRMGQTFGSPTFVLDRNKIRRDFEVLDVNKIKGIHKYAKEKEEFVVGGVQGVRRYIVSIYLSFDVIEFWREIITTAAVDPSFKGRYLDGIPEDYKYLSDSGYFSSQDKHILRRVAALPPKLFSRKMVGL